jgi:hypothetical protein
MAGTFLLRMLCMTFWTKISQPNNGRTTYDLPQVPSQRGMPGSQLHPTGVGSWLSKRGMKFAQSMAETSLAGISGPSQGSGVAGCLKFVQPRRLRNYECQAAVDISPLGNARNQELNQASLGSTSSC